MAYVVARHNGRFEIRESEHTAKGPRARTLAGFRVLTDAVLTRAAKKALRRFDIEAVIASAERAKAPIDLSKRAERGARRDREMDRDAFVHASRRMAAITSSPRARESSRKDAGEALIELLGFADAVARSRPAPPRRPLAFPVLGRLVEGRGHLASGHPPASDPAA